MEIFAVAGIFLLCGTHSHASTIPRGQVHERQQYNCKDTSAEAVFDGSCWSQLGLTDYVNSWTARPCNPGETGNGCILPNEPWSTAFLRLAKGSAGWDCTKVSTGNCDFTPDISDSFNKDNNLLAQVRYVAYTIFAINTFFNDWYLALNFALTQASFTIDPITQAFDPVKTSTTLANILSALTAGLAFIGTPALAPILGASTASAAGSTLTVGLQQAPGVAKALWPTGTADSQSVQISELSNMLGQQATALSDQLNAGLGAVMSDQHLFAQFASSGAWSGQQKLSIPQDAQGLTLGLTTYVLSSSLKGNRYVGAIMQYKSRFYTPGTNWCAKDDNAGSCYQNATLQGGVNYYMLDSKASRKHNDDAYNAKQHLIDAFGKGWTTPELLYQGALNCASSGFETGLPVNFDAQDNLDLDCMSQLDECWMSPGGNEYRGKPTYADGFPFPCVVGFFLNGGCPIRNCEYGKDYDAE